MTTAELVLPACAEIIHYCDGMDHDEFSRVRQSVKGIGASRAAAAAGLSKWDSPYSLWAEMTGAIPPKEQTPQMEWGLRLEPVVADAAAEKEGIWLQKADVILRSREYPFMTCTPDYWILGANGVVIGLLEVKSTTRYLDKEWANEEVPERVQLQALHQMIVTGLRRCLVAVLIDGSDLRTSWIDYDEGAAKDLIAILESFWYAVENRIEPPVDGTASTTAALAARFAESDPDSVLALTTDSEEGVDIGLVCADIGRLQGVIKDANKSLDIQKNRLRALLGEASVLQINGETRATWKEVVRKEHVVGASTSRVLRVFNKGYDDTEGF